MPATETAVDVVNAVDKVFTLVKSNEVETMPQLASALPPGVDPNTASHWDNWSATPQSLQNDVVYTPNLPGFSDTHFHLGVRFNWGGRADGQPWTYIKDLEAFVIIDSVTFVHELDIAVKFAPTGTPISSSQTVMLTGSFNVRQSHKLMGVEFSQFYGVQVFGNSAAEIKPL